MFVFTLLQRLFVAILSVFREDAKLAHCIVLDTLCQQKAVCPTVKEGCCVPASVPIVVRGKGKGREESRDTNLAG